MNPEEIPLRDLHLPDAVGWWPLAPGWWLLLALLATGLGLLLARAWKHWRGGAARRLSLKQLARLQQAYEAKPDAVALSVGLSALLRRSMLAYAPRQEVAGLTGRKWLEWLDRGLEEKPFSEGPGQVLEELPYRRTTMRQDCDVDGLIRAVRLRLKSPLPELR